MRPLFPIIRSKFGWYGKRLRDFWPYFHCACAERLFRNFRSKRSPVSRQPLTGVVFPIPHGVVVVAHVTDGSTKSEPTPAIRLPTSGDRPLDAVIVDERRDGPRWLCDDDDDKNADPAIRSGGLDFPQNHTWQFFDPELFIHYITFMGLIRQLRVVLCWSIPILKQFSAAKKQSSQNRSPKWWFFGNLRV